MNPKFKKPAIFIMVCILLVTLAIGAYAASEDTSADVRPESIEAISFGKNWEVDGVIVPAKIKPKPKKHLADKATPVFVKEMIDQRPHPSGKGLEPVSDQQ